MGRLVGIVLVLAVFVPFFAAADFVDGARRHAMATSHSAPVSHAVCRPASTDDCDDQVD